MHFMNKPKVKSITELFTEKFTISIELVPPKNWDDQNVIYELIETIKGSIDFVSVTMGAGGSLRGGSMPISYFAQTIYGIPALAHFTTSEKKSFEIENMLIDFHHFGLRNLLCLRGDPPAGMDKSVFEGEYNYAYKLVEHIKRLNKGVYLDHDDPSDSIHRNFCVAVAGHPEAPWEQEQIYIKSKVDAGADFIITQMLFDADSYCKYRDNLKSIGINIPVVVGYRPLTRFKQVKTTEEFFGINVPEHLKSELAARSKDIPASWEFAVNYSRKTIAELKECGAPGVHLFILNNRNLIDGILR